MHESEPATGWRFTRQPDGAVTITAPFCAVTFTPDAWASTCAALSARGESGDTYRMARAFHEMQPRRMETV